MLDAIKPLIDSGLINEDVASELESTWEPKLTRLKIKFVVNSEMNSHNDTSMTEV